MADENKGVDWGWFLTKDGLIALGAFITLLVGQITTLVQTLRNGEKAEQAAVNATEAAVRADRVEEDVKTIKKVQRQVAQKQGLPVNGPE